MKKSDLRGIGFAGRGVERHGEDGINGGRIVVGLLHAEEKKQGSKSKREIRFHSRRVQTLEMILRQVSMNCQMVEADIGSIQILELKGKELMV